MPLSNASRDRLIAAFLFAVALCVCWLASDGDALGDEAFYLYLARSFGTEPAAAHDYAWFHVLNRPLYYAIYHFATYAGFVSFRYFGSVLCASLVALVFAVARRLGASQLTAAGAALLLAFTRALFVYAAHGFPDVLASILALLALGAALQQRTAATFGFALACVLCKESFVALPLIAIWARGSKRLDVWAWLTLCVPTSYVVIVTLIGAASPGVHMQGWAQTPLSWTHLRGMWLGPELWPLLLWVVARRQWLQLGVWLGLPLFYMLWSWGLGRGLSPWYITGPAALSAAVVPGLIDACVEVARARWGVARARGMYALLALCCLPIAYSGVMRVAAQLRELPQHGLPRVQVAPGVVAILEQRKPERVLLLNCFWSYRYSHLRGPNEPATSMEWPPNEELQRALEAARTAQVTIMCRSPETRAKEQRLAASGFETLLVNEGYWVLSQP